jgi:prophage antirepressor-like protein
MSDEVVDGEKCTLIPYTFNKVEILKIEYEGRIVFLAQQLGAAWGYAEPKKLIGNISERWSEEFLEGDVIKLTNGALAKFKAAMNQFPDRELVDPRASHLILLTESGAQLAAILSRTPQGRAFRRWLVDVVLPERRKARSEAPPVAAVVRRTPRPRRVTGPAADLADLLDRYQRAGVLDPSAYTALRAQAERLNVILSTQRQRTLPAPPARRLLTGPVGSLEAELDQVLGPPPSDAIRRITYDVARQSLKGAAEARAGGGKPSSDNNIRRLNGIVTWMRWIRIPHMLAEDVAQALTRLEELTDSLFGSMPGAKVRAPQS